MPHLRTLGSLDLLDDSGATIDAVLAQPKRALLLAYLAVATPRGYKRRDIIVALFWPELDAERARAALRKSLYFLRGALGDVFITRGDEIAIDESKLSCDVVEFERACEDGRHEDALALFRGEFLPGVYARDAPDVERWADEERTRLAKLATQRAWILAETASDGPVAASWAARAVALARNDESSLRRQMLVLDRVGERLTALRVYEEFERTMALEYDGALPSADSRALFQRLRDHPRAIEPLQVAAPAPPAAAEAPVEHIPSATIRAHVPRSRWFAAVMTGFVIALLAVVATLTARWSASAATEGDGMRRIAVMPFTVHGERVAYLHEGMVDLLSISLQGAGDLSPIDPMVLIGTHKLVGETDSELERAREVARRVGARAFIVGGVVNAGGRLAVRAALFETESKSLEPAVVATASAAEAQLGDLVNDLTRDLVAGILDTPGAHLDRLAARSTRSLPALKSYLAGVRAMRTGTYGDAISAFRTAVSADSTFALAYYGLSMALGWASEGADREAVFAAARAVTFMHGLSPRDSLLLTAHLSSFRGQSVLAERQYRALLVQDPSNADVRYQFGDVIFHSGAITGHAMSDAADPFWRVVPVAPLRTPALTHLARIAAVARDSVALDSIARLLGDAARTDPRAREVAMLQSFIHGDSASRAAFVAQAAVLGDRDLWQLARAMATYTGSSRDAESLARLLTVPTRANDVRALGWSLVASIRAGAGRPIAARAAVSEAMQLDRVVGVHTQATIAALMPAGITLNDLREARTAVAAWSKAPAEHRDTSWLWQPRLYHSQLDAALRVRLRDSTYASRGAEVMEPVERGLSLAVAVLVDSVTSVASAQARLTELTSIWDVLHRTPMSPTSGVVRLARARLLRAVGKSDEALRWYATFPAYGSEDFMFRATAALERARTHRAAGDEPAAREALAEVAWLWRDAEPAVRAAAPEVFSARQR